MKNSLLAALIAMLLTGCALTPDDTARFSDATLCDLNGTLRASPLSASDAEVTWNEIVRRKLVTPEEIDLIKTRIVQVGMSECAMLAAWGAPDRQNTTVSARGRMIQHVYRRGGLSAQYVYTMNGVVTSIQSTGL